MMLTLSQVRGNTAIRRVKLRVTTTQALSIRSDRNDAGQQHESPRPKAGAVWSGVIPVRCRASPRRSTSGPLPPFAHLRVPAVLTGAALPATCGCHVGVLSVELMSVLAACLRAVVCSEGFATEHVDLVGDRLQVARSNAGPVPAQVVNLQTFSHNAHPH